MGLKEKIGIGSLALPIALLPLLVLGLWINEDRLELVLTEYSHFIMPGAIVLLVTSVTAFILGRKFPKHLFAAAGKNIGFCFIFLIIIALAAMFYIGLHFII